MACTWTRREFVKGLGAASALAAIPACARPAPADALTPNARTISRAWRPDAAHYGTIELHMAPDFERDDAAGWGLVIVKRSTHIERLRLVGNPDWFSRFDVLQRDGVSWQKALGGQGGQTALAGVHAMGAGTRLKVDRIEVVGLPGAGVIYENGASIQIGSGDMDRIGWPICGRISSGGGSVVNDLHSRDHWYADAWRHRKRADGGDYFEDHGQMAPQKLRVLASKHISARGELVMNEENATLRNYVQQGDGIGWKVGGSGLRVVGGESNHGYLSGVFPSNASRLAALPFLGRAVDMQVVEHRFRSDGAGHPRLLMFVAGRFDTPALVRKCVFVRGQHKAAVQLHTGARAIFDECEFIGWPDKASAFELEPARPGQAWGASTVEVLSNCKFYLS
jgi:hypothetical protein